MGTQAGLQGRTVLGADALKVGVLQVRVAMPPYSGVHSSRQLRRGAQAWSALASTAAYNRSANADAQVLRAAARRQCSGAGCLQR